MQERTQPTLPETKISDALLYFESKEINNGKLLSKDTLLQRLKEMAEGKQIPVVIFNCIFFNYSSDSKGGYPRYTAVKDTGKNITAFYAENIKESLDIIKTVGSPKPYIVIPDSELMDERVFPFTQNKHEREAIATQIKSSVENTTEMLCSNYDVEVILWSDYCKRYKLKTPFAYTEEAIARDIDTRQAALTRQVQDSFQYFLNRGINWESLMKINKMEFENRIRWYLAMYAGEGRALQDSEAIVLNFEDLRVRKWLRIGANGQLPVVTPVQTLSDYNKWKSA